jgi:hypothetical protein
MIRFLDSNSGSSNTPEVEREARLKVAHTDPTERTP